MKYSLLPILLATLMATTTAIKITTAHRKEHGSGKAVSHKKEIKAVVMAGGSGSDSHHNHGKHHSSAKKCDKTKDLKIRLRELQEEQKDLKHQHSNILIEVKELKKDNAQMEKQNKIWKQDADKLSAILAEVEKFSRKLADKKIIIDDLQKRLDNINYNSEGEVETLQKRIQNLEKENSTLRSEVEVLQNTADQAQKKINDTKNDVNNQEAFKIQIDKLTNLIPEKDQAIANLKTQINDLERTIKNLRSDVESMNGKIDKQKEANRSITNELNDLKSVRNALNNEINCLKKDLQAKNNQIQQLTEQAADSQKTIDSNNALIVKLKEEVIERENLLKQAVDLKKQIRSLRAKLGIDCSSSSGSGSDKKHNHNHERKGLFVGSPAERR